MLYVYINLDKANDSSSSCESDDEINAYNSHFSIDSKLFFENNSGNAFSVYRCLLTNKKVIIILKHYKTKFKINIFGSCQIGYSKRRNSG